MSDHPRYPRFDVRTPIKFSSEKRVVAHRLSMKAALALDAWPLADLVELPPARFSIKLAKWRTTSPIVLADRSRPAFLGQYPTIEHACRAMDNIVRRERGMPERITITTAEILERMEA